MKKILFVVCSLSLTLLFHAACEEEVEEQLTADEAVEIIESFLERGSGGLEDNIIDIANELVDAVKAGEVCDSLYTDEFSKEVNGSRISGTYTYEFSYELNCTSLGTPEEASFSATTASNFATQRLESDGESIFKGDAKGLKLIEPIVTINGDYVFKGSQLIPETQEALNSNFVAAVQSVTVNKLKQEIESGTATFSFFGSIDGTDFSYEGALRFTGGRTATLILNGTEYPLDWN